MFKFLCPVLLVFVLHGQTWAPQEFILTGGSSGFSNSYGHSWADIDGDGDPDLVTFGTPKLWINRVNENGTFANGVAFIPFPLPESSGNGGWAATFGDFDNDGDPDIYLGGYGRDYLLENHFPLPFVEVGEAYGVTDRKFCQSINWVDYNKDGKLDLYITHETPGVDGPHLFFESAYPQPFIPRFPEEGQPDNFGLADLNSHAYGLTWADVDIDGDLDAVTSACGSSNTIPNQNPHNKLYRNNYPEASFSDLTLSAGIGSVQEMQNGSDSYWATLFDYDGDAYPDLFIGDNGGSHRIWRNQALPEVNLGFELVPSGNHNIVGGVSYLQGACAGDFDNDGDLDLYVTMNGLYENDGHGGYTLRTDLIPPGSRDASWVDYDLDGHLDLFTFSELYRNPGQDGNHWLAIELIGDPQKGTTRDAHGVKIRVTAGGKEIYREHRFMVGTYSQHLLPTQFGLGSADQIDEILITWPNGDTTTYSDVSAIDQYLTIAQSGGCNGQRSIADHSITACAGETVQLQGATADGKAQWSILDGPSRSRSQFSNPNAAETQFTAELPGNYLLAMNLPGCYDETQTVAILDTDFDQNGIYSLADLHFVLPEWNSAFTFDADGDGRFSVLDFLSFCTQ